MKPIVATLLATALSAALTSAYAEPTTKTDTATYRTMTQKAAADFKAASALCKDMSGSARNLCMDEAKVTRARADLAALTDYNNTQQGRTKARTALANADYALAKTKCADTTGAEKESCMSNARAVHTAALADVKADRNMQVAATGSDAAKTAAADKCAQMAGSPNTGCLVDNNDRTAATTTAGEMANRTGMATDTAAQRSANAVDNAADKTRAAGATVAAKTERAIDTIADKTERATDTMAAKTDRVADKTGAAVADSVITTKVKADIFKEPELKSMAIHVETEKGVVLLSGFVDSKADAEKAVQLARNVNGVSEVKSAIKVK